MGVVSPFTFAKKGSFMGPQGIYSYKSLLKMRKLEQVILRCTLIVQLKKLNVHFNPFSLDGYLFSLIACKMSHYTLQFDRIQCVVLI